MGEVVTAETVLGSLRAGNDSYMNRQSGSPDRPRAPADIESEIPVAAVMTCSDLTVPPEHLFGLPVGKLYVSQSAMCVIGAGEVASTVFHSQHGGVKLVVVLGHSPCGVMDALRRPGAKACGQFTYELDLSRAAAEATAPDRPADQILARQHTRRMAASLRTRLGNDSDVVVVPAHFNHKTGKVDFL